MDLAAASPNGVQSNGWSALLRADRRMRKRIRGPRVSKCPRIGVPLSWFNGNVTRWPRHIGMPRFVMRPLGGRWGRRHAVSSFHFRAARSRPPSNRLDTLRTGASADAFYDYDGAGNRLLQAKPDDLVGWQYDGLSRLVGSTFVSDFVPLTNPLQRLPLGRGVAAGAALRQRRPVGTHGAQRDPVESGVVFRARPGNRRGAAAACPACPEQSEGSAAKGSTGPTISS